VLPQEAPNVLNINVFQRLRQQRARPACITCWPRFIQERQNAPVGPPATLFEPASPGFKQCSVLGSAPQAPCVASA
jgi:hypothetical protein